LSVSVLVAIASNESTGAQQPAEEQADFARAEVVVVDVSHLIDNHEGLRTAIEKLHKDVVEARKKLRAELTAMSSLHERMQSYKPQSPEYQRLDNDIRQRVVTARLQQTSSLRQIRQRQAEAYASAYAEIQREVLRFQRAQGIGIVLNVARSAPRRIEIPELDINTGADAHSSIKYSKDRGSFSWMEPRHAWGWRRRELPSPPENHSTGSLDQITIPKDVPLLLHPDPAEIEAQINQPVVAFLPERDITPIIQERLMGARAKSASEKQSVGGSTPKSIRHELSDDQ